MYLHIVSPLVESQNHFGRNFLIIVSGDSYSLILLNLSYFRRPSSWRCASQLCFWVIGYFVWEQETSLLETRKVRFVGVVERRSLGHFCGQLFFGWAASQPLNAHWPSILIVSINYSTRYVHAVSSVTSVCPLVHLLLLGLLFCCVLFKRRQR